MENCNTLDILSDKKVLYAEDEDGIRKNVVEILELFLKSCCSGKWYECYG